MIALPQSTAVRPYERGVGGRPTLVQNVETLAHVALIARHGDAWFRDCGRGSASGTTMVTVRAGSSRPTVLELAQGTTIAEAVLMSGLSTDGVAAVLLGGFFGTWIAADEAWDLPLDSVQLRAAGRSLGCGVIALLDDDTCGVQVTADIATFLGEQSAQQCGPCVFGLRAIAAALRRIAARQPQPHDLVRLRTWATEVRGRGACRHPDGAAGFVLSALDAFELDFARHSQGLACTSSSPGAHPWTW
jgi:NADH:ubiquinone oxidoreductase subunit F (NADH-binding)